MEIYIERARNMNQCQKTTDFRIDSELMEAIYRQYYKNVYNYIGFRINNHYDSEELASAVFENALRKFHTYKPESSPVEAWLIGIAKNVVSDYFRKKKRKHFVPLDEIMKLVSLYRQPEDVAVKNEENRALIKAMAKLKEKERNILSMKFATDLKNKEIAGILGISESNVSVIVHRSIGKLKNYLDKEENP